MRTKYLLFIFLFFYYLANVFTPFSKSQEEISPWVFEAIDKILVELNMEPLRDKQKLTRVDIALILNQLINTVNINRVNITEETQSLFNKLQEEFKDEIFLLEIYQQTIINLEEIKRLKEKSGGINISPSFTYLIEKLDGDVVVQEEIYGEIPSKHQGPTIAQKIKLFIDCKFLNYYCHFELNNFGYWGVSEYTPNLGMPFSTADPLKLYEGYIAGNFRNNEFKIGRQNTKFNRNGLVVNFTYSPIDAINIKRNIERINLNLLLGSIITSIDYGALKIEKKFNNNLSLNAIYSLTNIERGTEDEKIKIKDRSYSLCLSYRNLYFEYGNIKRNAKRHDAYILTLDNIYNKLFNLSLNLGYISPDYPLRLPPLYDEFIAIEEHHKFLPNTKGVHLILSRNLGELLLQFEAVHLIDTNNDPFLNRYILSIPYKLNENIFLVLENTYWDLISKNKGYNQLRLKTTIRF